MQESNPLSKQVNCSR